MKSDVRDHLQLPPKNEQVLFCKVTDEQKAVYQSYLKSDQIKSVIRGEHNLFVSLINLRKICNHPHLFDGGPNRNYSAAAVGKSGAGDKARTRTELGNRVPKRRASIETIPLKEEDEGEDIEIDPSDGFGHWHFSGKMVVVRTLLRVWQKQEQKVLLFTQSRQVITQQSTNSADSPAMIIVLVIFDGILILDAVYFGKVSATGELQLPEARWWHDHWISTDCD